MHDPSWRKLDPELMTVVRVAFSERDLPASELGSRSGRPARAQPIIANQTEIAIIASAYTVRSSPNPTGNRTPGPRTGQVLLQTVPATRSFPPSYVGRHRTRVLKAPLSCHIPNSAAIHSIDDADVPMGLAAFVEPLHRGHFSLTSAPKSCFHFSKIHHQVLLFVHFAYPHELNQVEEP